MVVLGIETSCDETAAAVFSDREGLRSNIIASQIEHFEYGGVVPELASRAHIRTILPVIAKALNEARTSLDEIDGIAVTVGPGLVGSLLVGLSVAKALAFARSIPLIGVNHIEAHIWANFVEEPLPAPPFVALVVSGGHTTLFYVPKLGIHEVMGSTRDDAAGEAFDKVAKLLGIGYPGGPLIDKLAQSGNPSAINLPRAYIEKGNFEFSFSGLKTAVLNFTRKLSKEKILKSLPDLAASFQAAVVDVLVTKTIEAAKSKSTNTVVLAGGVACNTALRRQLSEQAKHMGFSVFYPAPILCTDNAAMVAAVGIFKFTIGERSDFALNADPRLKIHPPESLKSA